MRRLYNAWQPLCILVLTTVFTATFFTVKDPFSTADGFFFCNADGSVQPARGTYQLLWDPNLYFTINMSFGKFSFTAVKLIDACWDTLVGRGGQMIVAIVAYRVLRRSIALSMEICTYPISTLTAIFCQQIQLNSAWELLHGVQTRHSDWSHIPRASPYIRLAAHILVFAYVLTFATLVSVMAGYRAEMEGYFGPEELMPLSNIYSPQMKLEDGVRIGLSESSEPLLFPETIPLPVGSEGTIHAHLDSAHNFGEPFGTLFDYYATCVGVLLAARATRTTAETPAEGNLTFVCADHACSCSIPFRLTNRELSPEEILIQLTSNITIDGKHWELPGPPLDIAMPLKFPDDGGDFSVSGMTASEIWFNKVFEVDVSRNARSATTTRTDAYDSQFPKFAYDNIVVDEGSVTDTGRCISLKAYSWGFSSLLLLTFCCDTIVFAAILLALEFDIYRHGRSPTPDDTQNIYHDVLFLADQLRSRFGDDCAILSTKALQNKVANDKQGIGLEVAEQPLSLRQLSDFALASERWERQLAAEAELREATEFTRLMTAARNASVQDDGGKAMAQFEDYLLRKERQAAEDRR